jgi:hypothetical protein
LAVRIVFNPFHLDAIKLLDGSVVEK